MSTRGVCGFRKGGKLKVMYNHHDSYPEYLGANLIGFIKDNSLQDMKDAFDLIVMVEEDGKPTKKQMLACADIYSLNIDADMLDGNSITWYWLLHGAQGNLQPFLEGLTYMIDSEAFMEDGLFCEWSYILDLDREVMEIYKGLWKTGTGKKLVTQLPFIVAKAMDSHAIEEYTESLSKKELED